MSRIAAVVVAWNGGEALERCVASLVGQGVHPLILVDNASQPHARQRLESLYGALPDVRLILLSENRGYAGGGNAGLAAALESDPEAILLATQDTVCSPGAVATLAAAMRACGAGIAGPVVVDQRSGRELSRGERVIPELLCLPRTLLRYRRRRDDAYEVSGLMGCLLLLSADCARATGGFDPELFAYYEEVDLCLRARGAGFSIVCAPAARVEHDGIRGFLAGFTPLAAELKARNLVWLMRKHGTPLRWLLFLPSYAALLAGSLALYGLRGRGDVVAALLRGAAAGFRRRRSETACG